MDGTMLPVYQTSHVFVAGGTPRVTYNPRQGQNIEDQLIRFLSDTGKALIVHGPTKSGKTTLVNKVLSSSSFISIQGQDLGTISTFWERVASHLSAPTEVSTAVSAGVQQSQSRGGAIAVGGASVNAAEARAVSDQITRGSVTKQSLPDTVRHILGLVPRPLVIDDFHFVADEMKLELTRALKTLIRLSPVILISVPYEAFEPVRREPEMAGRVWTLAIPEWEIYELAQIASDGFRLLNLRDPGDDVANTLAQVSYKSPFIVQQLCHDLVRWEFNIVETSGQSVTLVLPENRNRFFRESADRTEPPIFSELLAGAATKGQPRKSLRLRDGIVTDIYGALWTAVRNLVPPMALKERDIHAEVDRICETRIAAGQTHNALRQINKIAERRRGVSDPAVRFKDKTLFISDAFFAFYLVHGSWTANKSG